MNRAAVIAFGISCAAPATATAYQQTQTCDPTGIYACEEGETPKLVRWPTRCVTYYINEEGTPDLPDKDATFAAIKRSFETWSNIPDGEFRIEFAGMTDEDRAEYISSRGEAGNANVVMWREDAWEYSSDMALAVTSVTFSPADGIIADADVEFNGVFHSFTLGDTAVNVDVENTLTHEAGHFLGLDHSLLLDATMYRKAPGGETAKRDLTADDVAGYFATYPALGITPECPRDEPVFFSRPADKKDKGCCATTSAESPSPALALLMLLLVLYRRREAHEALEV